MFTADRVFVWFWGLGTQMTPLDYAVIIVLIRTWTTSSGQNGVLQTPYFRK